MPARQKRVSLEQLAFNALPRMKLPHRRQQTPCIGRRAQEMGRLLISRRRNHQRSVSATDLCMNTLWGSSVYGPNGPRRL